MTLIANMPHTENGITINFPDKNYFQFEGCQNYTTISGQGVKEMDVCWLDEAQNELWMIELKGFHNPANPLHIAPNLDNPDVIEKKLEELFLKSVHSLCMLDNSRSNTKNCVITGVSNVTKLKLIHIISLNPQHAHYLIFLNDRLQNKMKPYRAIFNVSSIAVLDHNYAISTFPWVI